MKRIIFSHESDIDGMGGVVLSKIAFDDIEYELFPNVYELENKFHEYLDNGKLNDYDEIYITDLSLLRPSVDLLDENSYLRKKVRIFDHHQRAIDDGLDKYDFSTIIEKDENGNKTCGTELFYRFLVKNGLVEANDTLDEFSELTRLEDTWSWKDKGDFGIKAHDLAIIFSSIGTKNYIDNLVNKIRNNSLEFDSSDLEIIKSKKDEYENRLRIILDDILYLQDDNNRKFGIVYAPYEYRNEITDKIITDGNENDIDYMIVVALDKGDNGQKSYRKVKDGIDVNEIAGKFGGGGHPGAAGVYLTKEQKEKALSLSKEEALKYLANCSYKK